jgi:uncharacterized repeat protein (TIGR03803 family)
MRSVRFVCLFAILVSMLVLAQSNRAPVGNQPNRLPVALELQLGAPHVQERAPFAQRQRTRDGAGASGGRARRRNARRPVQTGPEQVLYAFQGGKDGEFPNSNLIFDSSGNLYGTTLEGGGSTACNAYNYDGCGAAFKLSPNSSGGWTETILYGFQGGSDGWLPSSGLIFDHAGNLYGTTRYGGADNYGTVFELSPNGNGKWRETVLYSFLSSPDGEAPQGLIFDGSGNLYGATAGGGLSQCYHGDPCGTIFELSPNGSGGWTETIIYLFQGGLDSFSPNGRLIFDSSGNLYGTTADNGGGGCTLGDGCGTAFELSPNGSGGWTETTLYSFQDGSDGGEPNPLILDQSGNLYGTTVEGGDGACGYVSRCGTVFRLSPNGSGEWTETTLYRFQGGSDGGNPEAGLIFDKNGNLYGTNTQGGDAACNSGIGCGTTFELSPNGSGGWTESLLYKFQGGLDGAFPASGVIFDQTGNLYGTTGYGGGNGCAGRGCGVAFEVSIEPFVAFSPTNLNFGNQTVGITSSPQNVTLQNTGNISLTITSIQIIGTNSSDFNQTNNCPSSLSPNKTCQISVTFTPTANGTRNAAISVTDNAPGSPQSVPLTGVGVLPAVTFSPTSLTFPTQLVFTTSKVQPVQLTNSGLGILLISKIAVSSPFVQINNCPSSLNPNANCTISVKFHPGNKGVFHGAVSVTDNAPGSPQKVPLTGTGTFVQLVPTKLNFGTQPVGTRSLAKKITLTNKGSVTVNITKISITGADTADFAETNTCGKSVASGASCFIKVTFKPLVKGKRTADVSVYDTGGGSPQHVGLTGTGT